MLELYGIFVEILLEELFDCVGSYTGSLVQSYILLYAGVIWDAAYRGIIACNRCM